MVRLACVNLPALPLQLLLKRHRDWTPFPVAVVDRDTPQGKILWANDKAWKSRVRPGLRYADGLSIEPTLRAGAVSQATVEEGITALTRRLQRFSPDVEPSTDFPGIFWLNVAGLTPLYPSFRDWARSVRAELDENGFGSTIAIGFSRFGTYAAARSGLAGGKDAARDGIILFEDSYQERETVRGIPLERLDLDLKLREVLAKLRVETIGTFLRLPASGLLKRFGPQAHDLHRLASGKLWAPLVPRTLEEPIEQKAILDEAVVNVVHLLAIVKRLLEPMLERLAREQRALSALHVLLALDTRENRIETLRPAAPTLETAILLELLQLRLHAGRLPAGVVELELRGEAVRASREQIRLFAAASQRDLDAAARALARLRAELGDDAVVRARLREGHLPEAGFSWETWEPLAKLPRAHPRKVGVRTLIRRIQTRPVPLPPRPPSERNDNWLMQGLEYGPVLHFTGPYIVSGGWWASTVHREYHFVETRRGDLLWIYYDRKRRRWFLQGRLE